MDRCLYDETFGYYAAGRVRFGMGGQFSTYAEALSPAFGRMVARAIRVGIAALERSGKVPRGAPLTVLELGAGDGHLARDVLDELVARRSEAGWDFVDRLTYVVGDRSAALRERQVARSPDHIVAGRLAVRAIDAVDLGWEGPFHGLVFANELVDALPCEHLIVTAALEEGIERAVRRLMIWGDAPGAPRLDEDAFWDRVAKGKPLRVRSEAVPWTEAWPTGVPAGLEDYLWHLAPLVKDLAACELLPASVFWAPSTPRFVASLASLLAGEARAGMALLVDYGGTSRHVVDPRSRAPHARAYGDEGSTGLLEDPGRVDLTWDVDFTDLARLGRQRGLSVLHYGRQVGLEGPDGILDAPGNRAALVAARRAEGYSDREGRLEAQRLVASFRQSRGFQMLALAPEGIASSDEAFGPSASVDALDTVARNVAPEALDEALAPLGLDRPSSWLLPCCDPQANCDDHDAADRAAEVVRVLADRGWLRGAGEV